MERPEPSSIPLSAGVYLYKDAHGRIIYVGKARVLRRRVLSYFRPNGLAPKTVAMINRAASIEYITTTTEKEALLLEASLIKKHKPRYNIVLRDDKYYVLFKIDNKKEYPRLEFTRRVKRDGAKYFGPFISAQAARETWKLLHRAFPLRRCSDRMMKNRVRPCLYHHMGQCPAPCMGLADAAEYKQSVEKICKLLEGNADSLLSGMRSEMELASENLEFEKAARIRDQIKAVETTIERQAAILPGSKDMDAIGLYQSDRGLALGIAFVRSGGVKDIRVFYWAGLVYEDAPEVLSTFLSQFYTQSSPPPRILLPWIPYAEKDGQIDSKIDADTEEQFIEDKKTLEQIFSERRGSAVHIVAPQNAADRQLIELAKSNAREEANRRQEHSIPSILETIGNILNLKDAPKRIESVDVSHISGKQTRVGMVVYEDGLPNKNDYRIYSMPDSADDYATLYKWVSRRLESGPPWPDLLLIDGGKGQLASVVKAFEDAGQKNLIPLASIAKARDDNGHADRRAGNVSDRIFIPGRSNPLPLKAGSQELLFLQQIRDATHHFAIQGHRKARRSAAFSGELMRLPGVGPATARILWDKFGSLDAMIKASQEELMEVPGIGKSRARLLQTKLKEIHKS